MKRIFFDCSLLQHFSRILSYYMHVVASVMIMTLFFSACSTKDDGVDSESTGVETLRKDTIVGVAQKGQFIKGSSITIYALDRNLHATGLSYPAQTTDDMGSFVITNVDADYIDIKANGYYYNENKCVTSESTINLQAVSSVHEQVNVNILTTFAYNRIKYLVGQGLSFSDAQSRAQIEVLTALGFGNTSTTDFVDMNIAGSGDANGLLLAASLMIQRERSVGDVSKLISDIASDLEEDGILSSDLEKTIRSGGFMIDVGAVILGLMDFYEKNKVENYSIPTFYQFLDTDGDGKKDGEEGYIFKCIDPDETWVIDAFAVNPGYSAEGFTQTKHFLSTIPFDVHSDAAWLTVEKTLIVDNIYEVVITAVANPDENRTAHVVFTEALGKQLQTRSYQQKATDKMVPQRLVVRCDMDYMSYHLREQIGVNGKAYDAVSLPNSSYGYSYRSLYVDVPAADKRDTYQCYFPVDMFSIDGTAGSYQLTIPSLITTDDIPYVSLYSSHSGTMSNPAIIPFTQACPVIELLVFDHNTDYMVLSSSSPLCGKATFRFGSGTGINYDALIDETSALPDSDGKYHMTVKVNYHDDIEYPFYIPVLSLNCEVEIACYSSDGQLCGKMLERPGFF